METQWGHEDGREVCVNLPVPAVFRSRPSSRRTLAARKMFQPATFNRIDVNTAGRPRTRNRPIPVTRLRIEFVASGPGSPNRSCGRSCYASSIRMWPILPSIRLTSRPPCYGPLQCIKNCDIYIVGSIIFSDQISHPIVAVIPVGKFQYWLIYV